MPSDGSVEREASSAARHDREHRLALAREAGVDLTALERTQAALRESEERFAKAFRASPDAMSIARVSDGLLLEVNERWELLFERSRAEAIGQTTVTLGIYVDLADRARLRAAFAEDGSVRDFEIDVRSRTGAVRHVIVSADAVEMSGVPCMIVIARDVTARRRADDEIAEHRRQLAHLNRVSTVGELSAAIAHELNQPLTAMSANVGAARRLIANGATDPSSLLPILDDLVDDAARARAVIARLRTLLKDEPMHAYPLDLTRVVADVLAVLRADLEERAVIVGPTFAPDLPRVLADPVHAQQVLLNLILNACEAMRDTPPADRHLAITAAPATGGVELTVRDSGPGLSPSALPRLFEPFYTSKPDGLGLGLAICRTIVAALGGRLSAENAPGGGALFRLVLPAAPA